MYRSEQYVRLIDVDILEPDVQSIKHPQLIYFLVAKKKNNFKIRTTDEWTNFIKNTKTR